MDYRPEIWLPLAINDINRQSRANHYLNLIGRLKDGVTVQSAQAELNTLMENWGERVGVKPGPDAAGHVFYPYKDGDGHLLQMKPLQEQIVGGVSRAIWVLQAAVGLVLLIACANLANLLLARAQTREREFALRTVLGAGSGRLFRQLMTEGVLLSTAGGALGLLFARLGMYALAQAYPASLPRTNDISVDRLVLLFSFSVSVATGLIFGLVPLLHKRARGLADGLKESRSKGSIGGARHQLRRGLVIGEAALALMLVISAGLLVRTIYNINRIDAGFDRSRLTTFSLTLPQATYLLPSSRLRTFQPLLEKLRAVPGIQGATAMSGLPPDRPLNEASIRVENYTSHPGGPTENADYLQYVFADYFETMDIPILSGRSFGPTDTESSGLVVVVNETFAKAFWEGQDPIGRRVRLDITDQAPWWTVIGVAKDVKQGGVDRKTGSEVYVFLPQKPRNTFQSMNVVLRTNLPVEALAQNIENVVHQVDRAVPVTRFREMNAVFADSVQRPRLLAELVAVFAVLALLLAAIGTYGVLSFVVTERRREIGIRLALGADRRNVLGHIMKEGLLLTSIGVAAGLIGAFATNRLMVSLLFGVRPTDTTTVTTATMTIALVAAAACWLPAWRASRLDPNAVLRDE